MDASFEIFLPEDSVLSLLFRAPTFEWQGVDYPQGDPECLLGSNFKLVIVSDYDYEYIRKRIPSHLRNIKWKAIAFLGDGMDKFNDQLFKIDAEEIDFALIDILTTLLRDQATWLAVYEPQNDGFQEVKQGDIDDILVNLENSIKHSHQGFLIYH